MSRDRCTCRSSTPEESRIEGIAQGFRQTDWVASRRSAVLAGGLTLVSLLLGRFLGAGIPDAMARTLQKGFKPPAGSRKISSLKRLSAGAGFATIDPRTGEPAVVIRPSSKRTVKAYSAVCTHAGCTVSYDSSRRLLICPCHGSVFDPARDATVIAGPAPYPLPPLKVAVDPKGNIWLV